jgi:hypothetical protein
MWPTTMLGSMSILKRFWPLLLICVGFLIVLAGNFYFAWIEEGSSDTHPSRLHTSDLISLFGTFVLVVGIVASIIVFIMRRFRSKSNL